MGEGQLCRGGFGLKVSGEGAVFAMSGEGVERPLQSSTRGGQEGRKKLFFANFFC